MLTPSELGQSSEKKQAEKQAAGPAFINRKGLSLTGLFIFLGYLIALYRNSEQLSPTPAETTDSLLKELKHEELRPMISIPPCAEELLQSKFKLVTSYTAGNLKRTAMSELVIANQKEYSEKYGYSYVAHAANQAKKCYSRKYVPEECQPQWSKIAIIRQWLAEEDDSQTDSWLVWLDDDMVISNFTYSIPEIITLLQAGEDSSVIVTTDAMNWHDEPSTSVNTGMLFVRKDQASRELFNAVWKKRHKPISKDADDTLGTCKKQACLHEQQALADVLKENPNLTIADKTKSRVVAVVDQRTEGLGVNVFARKGCYVDLDRDDMQLTYGADKPASRWRPGDFSAQCTGMPTRGTSCKFHERTEKPEINFRKECVEELLGVVRKQDGEKPIIEASKNPRPPQIITNHKRSRGYRRR